jgi:hypothetical protein
VVASLAVVAGAGAYAVNRQQAALRNERVAAASLLDSQAAGAFDESRLIDARWELEMNRRCDIMERIAASGGVVREANLLNELQQLDGDLGPDPIQWTVSLTLIAVLAEKSVLVAGVDLAADDGYASGP